MSLNMPQKNGETRICTIEKARFFLLERWPNNDRARSKALHAIEAAMECMSSVDDARAAFWSAAHTAGCRPRALV